MAFDVTADMLAKHLGRTCGEIPEVRLLTKRPDPTALEGLSNSKKKSIAKGKAKDPSAPVSKGCAFVEFSSPEALQKALRFHHTQFHGRQINVELTAGGGGKSERRKEKIKSKNAGLDKERVRRIPNADLPSENCTRNMSNPRPKRTSARRLSGQSPSHRPISGGTCERPSGPSLPVGPTLFAWAKTRPFPCPVHRYHIHTFYIKMTWAGVATS